MIYLYLLITFICIFLSYKKYNHVLKEKTNSGWNSNSEVNEFYYIYILPFFWIIGIPLMLLWYMLDKIYLKFTK